MVVLEDLCFCKICEVFEFNFPSYVQTLLNKTKLFLLLVNS